MSLSLSELQPQEEAIVLQLPEEERVATRLREMGLLPGTAITFVRRAPLGDPLEIRLRGYSLSLRHSEAATILVEKKNTSSS
ncbi:MAG: FeoA family protein [Chthoniobacterales bacterium]